MLRRIMRRLGLAPPTVDHAAARISALEDLLAVATASSDAAWLYRNRVERMDAFSPIFPEDRRRFHLARYEFAAGHAQGRDAADIAGGTGYGAKVLADAGAASVVGVELDSDAVQYANNHYSRKNVRFVCASGADTALPANSFDLITSFETLEHVAEPEAMLDEFLRLLKPGGELILSCPNDWEDDDNPHHLHSFDFAQLKTMLSRRFTVLGFFNQNSGSPWRGNRGQPEGIVPTAEANAGLAECYIARCRKN